MSNSTVNSTPASLFAIFRK